MAISLALTAATMLLLLLAQVRDSGIVGSNGVRPLFLAGSIPPRQELCQTLGTAQREPTEIKITVGRLSAQPQRLTARLPNGGTRGAVATTTGGVITFSFPMGVPVKENSRVCIHNAGNSTVQVGGENIASAVLDGRVQPFAMSVTLAAEPLSLGAQSTAIVSRVGASEPGVSAPVAGWLVVSALGMALALALVTLRGSWS